MAFEGLIGQNEIKKMLKELCANKKVGHAYLFTGADGIGKKAFAGEFAKMCMCTAPQEDGSACGKCRACTLNAAGTNPDYIKVSVTDDKNTITVDQIRDDIREQTLKAPIFSARKVFLIDGAEKMNEKAQNALLKTLEEPPEYIEILLLVSNVSLLVDTIKSRTVRINLKRNSDSEILEKLDTLEGSENVNRALLCSYADGIMGRVGDFVNNSGIAELRKSIAELLTPVFRGNGDSRAAFAALIETKNKKYDFFFFQLLSFLRDSMVLSRIGSKAEILNEDYRDKLTELSREVGYYRITEAIEAVGDCFSKLGRNGLAELTIADMLNKISATER